jgi:hypothetical protein
MGWTDKNSTQAHGIASITKDLEVCRWDAADAVTGLSCLCVTE